MIVNSEPFISSGVKSCVRGFEISDQIESMSRFEIVMALRRCSLRLNLATNSISRKASDLLGIPNKGVSCR